MYVCMSRIEANAYPLAPFEYKSLRAIVTQIRRATPYNNMDKRTEISINSQNNYRASQLLSI